MKEYCTYPAYKPSGVPWLGDVPEHWEVVPNRASMNPKKDVVGACADDFTLLSLTRRGVIPRNVDNALGKFPSSFDTYQIIEPGDLVFCLFDIDETPSTVGRSRLRGIVTGAYARFVCADVDTREFLYLLYLSLDDGKLLRPLYSGLRKIIPVTTFLRAKVALPPKSEQRAIVRYLDYVDRRIRRYVAAKRKLIGLLEEEKQAVINQAVTRGLDPNVRLKPSGVEWLGNIPAHWDVRTLGGIADSFRTGPFGSALHQSDYIEGGTPVINPVHMSDGAIVEDLRCSVPEAVADRLFRYRLDLHDLLFARRGELGRCALVRSREYGWLCGTGSIRVRVEYEGIEPEFLIQALQVPWVGEFLSLVSVGATMENLNTAILKGVPILIPPIEEQRDLLRHISRRRRDIDAAIERARRQIELVEEYRTRLIADVVTGKLDVRDAAAQLPNEADGGDPTDEGESVGYGRAEPAPSPAASTPTPS